MGVTRWLVVLFGCIGSALQINFGKTNKKDTCALAFYVFFHYY